MYDVIIIGAGVIGSLAAKNLSRYNLKTAVLEKNCDAGFETSSRNSGVLHSGIHYKPGSLRAEMNVRGNAMMPRLCEELYVKHKYTGKLTVAYDDDDVHNLYRLKEQGEANGVPGLEVLDRGQMLKIQPGIGGIKALYSPTTGIISPYTLTIHAAEYAKINGTDFYFNSEVTGITHTEGLFHITAGESKYISKILINAAGLHSAEICRMLNIFEYRIFPCRGEYYILDKKLKDSLQTLVYPVPGKNAAGLGIHLTSTVDGNILIGPSNEYVDRPDDYENTIDIMNLLIKEGHDLLPQLRMNDFIRSFSGIRPKQNPPEIGGFADFVIEKREDVPGFINLTGIESPGLTSAPAIAETVEKYVIELCSPAVKENQRGLDKKFTGQFTDQSDEIKDALIHQEKDYACIFCRCEQVTKKEVRDAVENPLGAVSLAGIKYRSRAMMGRCQGGFCLARITEMLVSDYGYNPEEIFLKNSGSAAYMGPVY